MSDQNNSKEIIANPEKYLSSEGQKLEDRLKAVSIGSDEEEIIRRQTGKVIRDSVLGAVPLGQAISTLLNWNEAIDADIEEAKKNKLLEMYMDKSEANEASLNQIKRLLTNPQGNTLFNKILQILRDSPPDIELIEHLASALKHVAESDFASLFESHKYALAQIEKLTPQGLTILSDHRKWPPFHIPGYQSNGGKIVSDWLTDFVQAYAPTKNIHDRQRSDRLLHALNDLRSDRLIDAWLVKGQDKTAQVALSSIGQTIIPYIDA